MAKKTSAHARITRQLLTDALVYNCPRYTRDGFASRCSNLDGTFSNCTGKSGGCSYVSDIFQTMQKIADGEIEVW